MQYFKQLLKIFWNYNMCTDIWPRTVSTKKLNTPLDHIPTEDFLHVQYQNGFGQLPANTNILYNRLPLLYNSKMISGTQIVNRKEYHPTLFNLMSLLLTSFSLLSDRRLISGFSNRRRLYGLVAVQSHLC